MLMLPNLTVIDIGLFHNIFVYNHLEFSFLIFLDDLQPSQLYGLFSILYD